MLTTLQRVRKSTVAPIRESAFYDVNPLRWGDCQEADYDHNKGPGRAKDHTGLSSAVPSSSLQDAPAVNEIAILQVYSELYNIAKGVPHQECAVLYQLSDRAARLCDEAISHQF